MFELQNEQAARVLGLTTDKKLEWVPCDTPGMYRTNDHSIYFTARGLEFRDHTGAVGLIPGCHIETSRYDRLRVAIQRDAEEVRSSEQIDAVLARYSTEG